MDTAASGEVMRRMGGGSSVLLLITAELNHVGFIHSPPEAPH